MRISTFFFLTRRGLRNLGKHWAMTIACIASLSVCMTLNTFASLAEVNVDSMVSVSYTHLDVYKRQGFRYEDAYLTFQEYFERLGTAPERWGKPLAALLGALDAQMGLGIASIGGKDSMSGSFEKLDVPPTLVSLSLIHI